MPSVSELRPRRAYLLLAGAALALAACGNNDQTDNTANVDENLSAENIVSNDVTAIDAVTGEAANMAADVDVNFTSEQQLDNGSGNGAAPASRPPRTATPGRPAPQSSAPATQPAQSNTTSNAVQ